MQTVIGEGMPYELPANVRPTLKVKVQFEFGLNPPPYQPIFENQLSAREHFKKNIGNYCEAVFIVDTPNGRTIHRLPGKNSRP